MVYNTFLTTVKETLHSKLGAEYDIIIQQIPKNNGILLDGLSISKAADFVAPTIYLNSFYEHFKDGTPLEDILEEILNVYKTNTDFPKIAPKQLADFKDLKDKVVYKLVQTCSNTVLLKDIPHIPYLDLSVVFYLYLEESEYGHMTALIHTSHIAAWKTSVEELHLLASQNTPRLLPADLKSMSDVMKQMAKDQLGDDIPEDFLEQLIPSEHHSPLYVLSNHIGLNGACTILYEDLLKNFADTLGQDLVILPSSIHEVLLLPYDKHVCVEELSEMVAHINLTEVSAEDLLSNHIYLYSRLINQVSVIPIAPTNPLYS